MNSNLEHQPTGNLAARLEFKFGKNCIENGLWKEADELIEKYAAQLRHVENKYYFKEAHIPTALEPFTVPENGKLYRKFTVRDYLKGNLSVSDSELPEKIEMP